MVPIFARVPPLKDPEQLTKMDVLSQKVGYRKLFSEYINLVVIGKRLSFLNWLL